ncbi:MAG: 5-formyltetrahydrofolate cyclo-ligase [Rickettsia sp.]|nr:5-formyltetrahydrofolate cyclo-ligase [Rickettsia sp.]
MRKKSDKFDYVKSNLLLNQNLIAVLKSIESGFYKEGKKKLLGMYCSLQGEPDLTKIMFNMSWKIALPKIYDRKFIKMISWNLDQNNLTKGDLGILEPISNEELMPDVMIVPGVAFSIDGYRIGFGHGYYDQYLSRISNQKANFFSIGVCFHQFLIENFIQNSWDFKFHFVITNKIILKL